MSMKKHPYNYTATGILGEQRDTMLRNELHLRNELGHCQKRGYTDYPGDKWRYGLPNPPSDGGVAEAIGNWRLGQPSHGAVIHYQRDFVSLNRESTKAGIVKPDEQYQYRATHDIRLKGSTATERRSPRSNIRKLPPSMVFGISTRPSTPIHDLLENKYQDKWINDMKAAEMAQRKQIQQSLLSSDIDTNIKKNRIHETRASMLRQHMVPVQSAPLWKMPKFSRNAVPNLSTFRTEAKTKAAYSANVHDRIGRQGVEGAGIYVSAVN